MVNWKSHNPTPPSLVYPPDGSRWHRRKKLPGTQTIVAPNGQEVCIGELRGWLCHLYTNCEQADPDWHYFIVLDFNWLDALGIEPERYLLPGDVLGNQGFSTAAAKGEVVQRSSVRAQYSEAILHLEIDAWPRSDPFRGSPPQPSDWTFTNDCRNGGAVWPYDPRNPKPGDPPLSHGQYVSVVGSLVTDDPHMMEAQFIVNSILRIGYAATLALPGMTVESADAAHLTAIKWLWGEQLSHLDEQHPARWNEIHSPDYIEVLPPKQQRETVRCIAIVAQNGSFLGDIEELSARIPAPARMSRWQVLTYRKSIGSSTIASTVLTDEATPFADHLYVRVRVQGQRRMGANGKYFAIYRVGWRGMAPFLSGASSSDGQMLLTAVDADDVTMARLGNAVQPYWASSWFVVQVGRAQAGAPIDVVSRAPAHFDAFVVGVDAQVHTAATDGVNWGGWWLLPGVRAVRGGAVRAVSSKLNKLDIYTADDQGQIMTATWEQAPGWSAWAHVLGGLTAPGGHVACISRRAELIDIFTVGIDGNVHTAAWAPPVGWQGWWRVGTTQARPGAPISCVSRSTDKLDLFLADAQGRVISAAWEPGAPQWSGWWHILGGLTAPNGSVVAVSRDTDLLDIFTVGIDGNVHTAAWSPGNGWQGWWPISGVQCIPGSSLCALSPSQNLLVIIVSTTNGDLMSSSWSPSSSGWTQWASLS